MLSVLLCTSWQYKVRRPNTPVELTFFLRCGLLQSPPNACDVFWATVVEIFAQLRQLDGFFARLLSDLNKEQNAPSSFFPLPNFWNSYVQIPFNSTKIQYVLMFISALQVQ